MTRRITYLKCPENDRCDQVRMRNVALEMDPKQAKSDCRQSDMQVKESFIERVADWRRRM